MENYNNNGIIQNKIDALIEKYTSKHSKTLPIRFDIRYPECYECDGSNGDIMKLVSKVNKKLKRDDLDPAYLWVREQVNSKNPHYHCCIFLNGHKTKNPERLFPIVNQLWKSTINTNNNGLIHKCNVSKDGTPQKNGIMLRNDDADYLDKLAQVKHQLNYLAKAKDKGPLKDGVRNFGMSRI